MMREERNERMKHRVNSESEDLRGMRESIEEMEQELKGMEKDLEEAKKIPDPEMREVAVRDIGQLRKNTIEMIASFKETYKVMKDSEAKGVQLLVKGA